MFPHLVPVTTVRSTQHELAVRQVAGRSRTAASRSGLLLLTCLLALATGVALLVLARTVAPPTVPPVVAAAPSVDTVAVVHAFYAAANDALRTGNAAGLDGLLVPDLVEHADRPGLPPGPAGLIRHLARLRAAHPTLRFEVEQVLADGDLVSARVAARTSAWNVSLDESAAQNAHWTGVDVFRVVEGRVAERWSGSDAPTLGQPLARVPLDRWPPGTSTAAAARLTVAPGAAFSGAALHGPGLIVVEAGALAVRGAGEAQVFRGPRETVDPSRLTVPPGIEQVLGPGDVVAFPAGTGALSLRNEGTEPVVAVAVAWFPAADGQEARAAEAGQSGTTLAALAAGGLTGAMLPTADGGRVMGAPGVTVTPLGSLGPFPAAQVPPGRVAVRLDRVILAPGASLPPRAATGSVLLIVEGGTVGLVPVRETAWIRSATGSQEAASIGSEATLAEGDVAFWDAEAVALLRAGHERSGSVLILTIGPEASARPTTPRASSGRPGALPTVLRVRGIRREVD